MAADDHQRRDRDKGKGPTLELGNVLLGLFVVGLLEDLTASVRCYETNKTTHIKQESDVFLLGLLLGHGALELSPSLVLCLADKVEHAGSGSVAVTFGSLLVVCVELERYQYSKTSGLTLSWSS